MIPVFEKAGLIASGMDDEGELKIMEYNRNDFFVITLFLPQFRSSLTEPHPLITAFFKSAAKRREKEMVSGI
jgi:CTP synthase